MDVSKIRAMKKDELVDEIIRLHDVLDTHPGLPTEKPTAAPPTDPKSIARHSPEWQDYVTAQFWEKELVEGKPKCDGLRRVFEKLIGPIMSTEIDCLQTPSIANINRSTVKCRIKFKDMLDGEIKEVSDLSDCDDKNTKKPFSNYPSNTAATTAESRCLRKALRYHTVSFEEVGNIETSTEVEEVSRDASSITDTQKKTIENMSKKLGIVLNKFLQQESKSPDMLMNYTEAQELLNKLNAYSRGPNNGGEQIPDALFE